MSNDEADLVDRFERDVLTPRPGQIGAFASEICAFWRRKLAAVRTEEQGLKEYLQRREELECARASAEDSDIAKETARRADALKGMAALTQDEARLRACEPTHRRALEALAMQVKTGMAVKIDWTRRPRSFVPVDEQLVVTTAEAAPLTLPRVFGEVHVFVFGAMPLTLDVQQDGHAVTTVSPWQESSTWVLGSDTHGVGTHLDHPLFPRSESMVVESRVLHVRVDETASARITGQGCVLAMVFRAL